MPSLGRNAVWMLASILLLAFLFQSYSASRLKSPTFDEPLLIPAGLSYVQTGIFRLDLQQPPLLQELAGLSLVFSGIRWPKSAEASQMLKGNGEPEWRFGSSWVLRSAPNFRPFSCFPLADCCLWRPCGGRRKLRTKAALAFLTGLL
jgi:hypothetical protein